MIVYKVEDEGRQDANEQIKDMQRVLAEIAPTLKVLQELIAQHEAGISSPSINRYREELKHMIANAAMLSRNISENSQKLVVVSEQAGKYLKTIDSHFAEALGGAKTSKST